jgi:hypothetical protein
MRIETFESSIKLIERREGDGLWVVRWDFKPKLDNEGNETGMYWYEEEAYNWIPTIEDIQRTIVEWFNKQTDGIIQHGFKWKGIRVLLNEENKFNYKAIRDEAKDREDDIRKWDEEHPELAGLNVILKEGIDQDGNPVQIPTYTGRPQSLLPITLKLGESNAPENFYVFTTLAELKEFFSAGVEHLLGAYGAGWYNIATYDWSPYVKALEEL